jgi:hypothetical protein
MNLKVPPDCAEGLEAVAVPIEVAVGGITVEGAGATDVVGLDVVGIAVVGTAVVEAAVLAAGAVGVEVELLQPTTRKEHTSKIVNGTKSFFILFSLQIFIFSMSVQRVLLILNQVKDIQSSKAIMVISYMIYIRK